MKEEVEILTKKIGPLPVWAYLAGFGGILFLLKKRAGSSIQTPTSTGTPAMDYGSNGMMPMAYGGFNPNYPGAVNQIGLGAPTPQTDTRGISLPPTPAPVPGGGGGVVQPGPSGPGTPPTPVPVGAQGAKNLTTGQIGSDIPPNWFKPLPTSPTPASAPTTVVDANGSIGYKEPSIVMPSEFGAPSGSPTLGQQYGYRYDVSSLYGIKSVGVPGTPGFSGIYVAPANPAGPLYGG